MRPLYEIITKSDNNILQCITIRDMYYFKTMQVKILLKILNKIELYFNYSFMCHKCQ